MRSESAEPAQLVFAEKQISPRGIYEINRGGGGEKNYIKIKYFWEEPELLSLFILEIAYVKFFAPEAVKIFTS